MRSHFRLLLAAGLCLAMCSDKLRADDFVASLRLQYWSHGVDGRISVRGSSLDISDADKVLDGSNNGFALAGDYLFEDWGLNMDMFWGLESGEKTISSSQTVDWDAETAFLTVGAFRRLLDQEFRGDGQTLVVDVSAGLRPVSNYYQLHVNPYDPLNDQNRSAAVSWIDPLVGLRLKAALNPKWEFELYGDVGGFGVGDASELSVLARADVMWNMAPALSLVAGYRFFDLKTERQNGSQQTEADLQMGGPTLGFQGRF